LTSYQANPGARTASYTLPTQFIYLALTPAQTSRTNYTHCGSYIISLRVRLAWIGGSYYNWAGAIQKTVICGS